MAEKYDKYIPVYESIRRTIEPELDPLRPALATSIYIRDILREAERLGIEVKDIEIDSFLQGLIEYFSKLGIEALKSTTSGDISFTKGLVEGKSVQYEISDKIVYEFSKSIDGSLSITYIRGLTDTEEDVNTNVRIIDIVKECFTTFNDILYTDKIFLVAECSTEVYGPLIFYHLRKEEDGSITMYQMITKEYDPDETVGNVTFEFRHVMIDKRAIPTLREFVTNNLFSALI